VTDSIERSGGIDNKRALQHLLSLLKYVSGDYKAPGTFTAIKEVLGKARRPAHYLAIPPSLFETVIKGLGAANLAEHARVIVEKPFGRDLASARELNQVAHSVFPEDSIFRIDHFLGKEGGVPITECHDPICPDELLRNWQRETENVRSYDLSHGIPAASGIDFRQSKLLYSREEAI
jgi:glucose-6-phosphate 1-dehydrogenase